MKPGGATEPPSGTANPDRAPDLPDLERIPIEEHIVEIVSDSGEGAQKAGQSFGTLSAKMGNGVWTVEIIPAEIQPPQRSRAGASGIRIRLGSGKVTNMGDTADLVVAFNEQVLYSRIEQGALRQGTLVLLENKWATSNMPEIREAWVRARADFERAGLDVREVPMETECLKLTDNPFRGKNMWVLGLLCHLYQRDLEKAEDQIRTIFRRKGDQVIDLNLKLLRAGTTWARTHLGFYYDLPTRMSDQPLVVMNGNEAVGLGAMASGMEVCSMYPITPATSVSHYLSEVFRDAGGVVHQAEDEIAAIGFAIGCSYAGKTAFTVTSGPGLALKDEFIGLAVMAEVPLVVVVVQRGGPSTGLPTKVEQSDLLSALYAQPGDPPKIILAPATIEECFHFMITARQLAELTRGPVIVLTDANLATGVQPYPRPQFKREWLAPPIDQSPWKPGVPAYDWDPETGFSQRPIPGQKDGMYVLTGLAHDEGSHVAYDPETHERGCNRRSRKVAAFQSTLKSPKVHGEGAGDLLLVGWGSTMGAIEEAVDKARKRGARVSSLHLRILSPFEPGLREIFGGFKKVMTIELNYSDSLADPYITPGNRRYAQLAWLLRAKTLVDVDCFSVVHGHPLQPAMILEVIEGELARLHGQPGRRLETAAPLATGKDPSCLA
ncbi:MAG: 2-oxoacid:acceptor oxidoreductase subunit alpha [Planctomycetes bacterium]|nr:2-oxoacid:acceptor oxidoreductase subunit alpha [Planctomycetota bacterium]